MTATKILATLGPASSSPEMIRRLVEAGMSGARLNFSHGGVEKMRPLMAAVREAERATGRVVTVVADLQGPKIRLGRFPGGPVALAEDARVTLEAGEGPCSAELLRVDYPDLAASVRIGGDLFIADGLIHLRVEAVAGGTVRAVVVRGGTVSDRKGVNLPGVALNLPSITDKDYRDAVDAVGLGSDMLALSFVRSADDIHALREHLRRHAEVIPIIAKLERPEAIAHLDEVVAAADAVMVARGDLGVEIGVQRVPAVQKRVLELACRLDKPAIVATQMLESMTHQPIPTRAEAADVANAILDGADVVMLSGETAMGEYPLETVRMMGAIAGEIEPLVRLCREDADDGIAAAVVAGVVSMVDSLAPAAVVAYTSSGYTARLLAKRRLPVPLIALTPDERVARLCNLYYGCEPLPMPGLSGPDEMFARAADMLLERGRLHRGDRVVFVAGLPFGHAGTTNLIHVAQLARH